MDGFKNSTKTQYIRGGSVKKMADGGAVMPTRQYDPNLPTRSASAPAAANIRKPHGGGQITAEQMAQKRQLSAQRMAEGKAKYGDRLSATPPATGPMGPRAAMARGREMMNAAQDRMAAMRSGNAMKKGGEVKGAAKISKVMGEFKSGTLHSGSKKGPEVTNPKQAVAIALSEARKAGAKIPVKKADGGAVARGNRMQALEAREEQRLMREARESRKTSPKGRETVSERRMAVQRDVREPLIRNPLMDRLTTLPSQRGEFPIRRAQGGLAAMPCKKK